MRYSTKTSAICITMMLSAATLFGCSTSDDSTDVTVEPTPISETTSASDFTEAQLEEILEVRRYFDEEEENRSLEAPTVDPIISIIEFNEKNDDIRVLAQFRNVPWEVLGTAGELTFEVGGTLNPETGEITWDDNNPLDNNSGAERQQVTEEWIGNTSQIELHDGKLVVDFDGVGGEDERTYIDI